MSRMTSMLGCFAAALIIAGTAQAADEYDIDGTHTYPLFSINHAGLSTLHGRFDNTSGSFILDREGGKSSVDAVIKVASLNSGHEGRDKILRSDKFFDAEKFPDLHYVSTQVSFPSPTTASVEGKLTLHGVTKPVKLDVQHLVCAIHPLLRVWSCGFDAYAKIKRSDFGMTAYLPNMVGDEVTIEIAVEAHRIDPAQRGGRR
jgi:polyisoprenoid-binding protein YceI